MSKTIFVFGSNTQGRHGKGAALEAKEEWGAINGQASGPQGFAYGIVTKELRWWCPKVTLDQIKHGVDVFREYAFDHLDYTFRVTPIGCGLAGFKPEQIAPFFRSMPDNVYLPDEFINVLRNGN